MLALQAAIILLTCAGYLGVSSLLILLNKYLMVTDRFGFPLILSGSGMLVTWIASSVLVRFRAIVPERQVPAPSLRRPWQAKIKLNLHHSRLAALRCSVFLTMRSGSRSRNLPPSLPPPPPPPPLPSSEMSECFVQQVVSQGDYVKRILPLGFCSASTLALGNIAYLHLDVGLLQMLKSCCPVFVMLVAIAFRLERFSLPLVASIVFIAAGTATTAATGARLFSCQHKNCAPRSVWCGLVPHLIQRRPRQRVTQPWLGCTLPVP